MRMMELAQFCATSRVVIVAGKGGVGKTTVTATLAAAAARTGMSVLIVEVEGKSGLATCLGSGPLAYDETEVLPGLRARVVTPDHALLEYLQDRGLRRISNRLVRSGALDIVATAVPGMRDILVLGKVKQLERAGEADLIVIDTPAAGHAVNFLLSPKGLVDAVRVGPVRAQAEEVVAMLGDPSRCQVMLVTLPEETPVNELIETAYALEDRVGVKLGPVVVNACYAQPLDAEIDPARDAMVCGVTLPDADTRALIAVATFVGERQAVQHAQVARLARELPLPQLRLPFVFAPVGPATLEQLVDAFADQVAALAAPAVP
jgi:anion-transporting  ArsA/GET3 family ATPase